MSIESEVFKRRNFSEERLLAYGFERTGDILLFRRKMSNGLYAVLSYKCGDISGKVFDEETDEEYTVFRLEGVTGAFVVGVRSRYISLLEDVRDSCSDERLYITEQSERIAVEIRARYGAEAEFLWEKFPHYTVFRNGESRKWFAIIMDIDRSKVSQQETGVTDVMNVKTGDRTPEFVAKGAYSCFHMNDRNWVSIILDDRLSDDLVMEMIEVSYRLSFGNKKTSSV